MDRKEREIMALYDEIRKEVSERRKKKELIWRLLDRLGWKNAKDRQDVEGWDDYHTIIETGYNPNY